MLVSYSLA